MATDNGKVGVAYKENKSSKRWTLVIHSASDKSEIVHGPHRGLTIKGCKEVAFVNGASLEIAKGGA